MFLYIFRKNRYDGTDDMEDSFSDDLESAMADLNCK